MHVASLWRMGIWLVSTFNQELFFTISKDWAYSQLAWFRFWWRCSTSTTNQNQWARRSCISKLMSAPKCNKVTLFISYNRCCHRSENLIRRHRRPAWTVFYYCLVGKAGKSWGTAKETSSSCPASDGSISVHIFLSRQTRNAQMVCRGKLPSAYFPRTVDSALL